MCIRDRYNHRKQQLRHEQKGLFVAQRHKRLEEWEANCFDWHEDITVDEIVPSKPNIIGRSNFVKHRMDVLVESMFVRKYHIQYQKSTAEKMAKLIRETFHSIIQDSSWMDVESKYKARQKLSSMTQVLGYPDQLVNRTLIDDFFKGKLK